MALDSGEKTIINYVTEGFYYSLPKKKDFFNYLSLQVALKMLNVCSKITFQSMFMMRFIHYNQLEAFTGQKPCVDTINNYVTLEDLKDYTIPQG
jgi:hypothetical protein